MTLMLIKRTLISAEQLLNPDLQIVLLINHFFWCLDYPHMVCFIRPTVKIHQMFSVIS